MNLLVGFVFNLSGVLTNENFRLSYVNWVLSRILCLMSESNYKRIFRIIVAKGPNFINL